MKRMNLIVVVVVACALCGWIICPLVRAQDASSGEANSDAAGESTNVTINPPKPLTQIEAMLRQTGSVIVKAFTDVADLSGDNGYAMRVTAIELIDHGGDGRRYGLAIEVHESSRGWPRAVAYLDEDEIDPLAAALDAARNLNRNESTMRDLATQYRTRGSLEFTTFDVGHGPTLAVRTVQSDATTGRTTWATVRFAASRITEIQQQLATAKQTIDAAKQAQKQNATRR